MIEKEQIVAHATNLKSSLSEVHSYITLFGFGVITGFICRRFFKIAILSFLISLALIKVLEFQDILKIDWQVVSSFLGIDTNLSIEQSIKDIYVVASENVYLTGAVAVGFLIGYRAG